MVVTSSVMAPTRDPFRCPAPLRCVAECRYHSGPLVCGLDPVPVLAGCASTLGGRYSSDGVSHEDEATLGDRTPTSLTMPFLWTHACLIMMVPCGAP